MTANTFAKGAVGVFAAAIALTAGLSAPGLASAQGYYDSGYRYDPCRREKTTRGTTGGLVGAALGAVIGSNAASRGVRTEGALLGGAVGGVAGAVIGNNSAACTSDGYTARSGYYDDRRYDRSYYSDDRYGDRYAYERNRYAPAYDGYAYDDRGSSYVVTERSSVGADGCTLAESPIYLPDGRVQKRFVRVCQDGAGRYQVVD